MFYKISEIGSGYDINLLLKMLDNLDRRSFQMIEIIQTYAHGWEILIVIDSDHRMHVYRDFLVDALDGLVTTLKLRSPQAVSSSLGKAFQDEPYDDAFEEYETDELLEFLANEFILRIFYMKKEKMLQVYKGCDIVAGNLRKGLLEAISYLCREEHVIKRMLDRNKEASELYYKSYSSDSTEPKYLCLYIIPEHQ